MVARVEDLPAGQRKIVRVGQREIGVFHTTAGLFALRNVCPHQGAPCAWVPSPGPPSPPPPGSTSGAWRGGPALPLARLGVQSETGVGLYDPYRHERVATYEVRVEGDEVVLPPEPREPREPCRYCCAGRRAAADVKGRQTGEATRAAPGRSLAGEMPGAMPASMLQTGPGALRRHRARGAGPEPPRCPWPLAVLLGDLALAFDLLQVLRWRHPCWARPR